MEAGLPACLLAGTWQMLPLNVGSPRPRGPCCAYASAPRPFRFRRPDGSCFQIRLAMAEASPARTEVRARGEVAGPRPRHSRGSCWGQSIGLSGAHAVPGGFTPILGDVTAIPELTRGCLPRLSRPVKGQSGAWTQKSQDFLEKLCYCGHLVSGVSPAA